MPETQLLLTVQTWPSPADTSVSHSCTRILPKRSFDFGRVSIFRYPVEPKFDEVRGEVGGYVG
jgi:hypothetical protein